MGVDFLDMTFRLEKSFGIQKLPISKFEFVDNDRHRDSEAGKVLSFVCRILVEKMRIPHSSWHRVQLCVARACDVPRIKVKPQSWLIKDLAVVDGKCRARFFHHFWLGHAKSKCSVLCRTGFAYRWAKPAIHWIAIATPELRML